MFQPSSSPMFCVVAVIAQGCVGLSSGWQWGCELLQGASATTTWYPALWQSRRFRGWVRTAPGRQKKEKRKWLLLPGWVWWS